MEKVLPSTAKSERHERGMEWGGWSPVHNGYLARERPTWWVSELFLPGSQEALSNLLLLLKTSWEELGLELHRVWLFLHNRNRAPPGWTSYLKESCSKEVSHHRGINSDRISNRSSYLLRRWATTWNKSAWNEKTERERWPFSNCQSSFSLQNHRLVIGMAIIRRLGHSPSLNRIILKSILGSSFLASITATCNTSINCVLWSWEEKPRTALQGRELSRE